jgi:hypothetical protein
MWSQISIEGARLKLNKARRNLKLKLSSKMKKHGTK